MKEGSGKLLSAQTAQAMKKNRSNLWRAIGFVTAGVLLILFFWPAFYWAGEQLESGDEPWQLVLVPFLSGMVISQRFSELRGRQIKSCKSLGIPVMLGGAFLNLLGIVIEHPMPSQVGMIAFIHGSVLFLWGGEVYRTMLFPLMYLFLAVPLPRTVLVAMTGSLKVVGATVAGKILSLLGFAVIREGAILQFPRFSLVVADECSGLQSLITLGVVSLPVAYLMEGRLWKKGLVVLISLPLALAANVIRLCVTAFLGNAFGEKATQGTPHTMIGMAIVFLAFFALYGLSVAISDESGVTERAKQDVSQD